MQLLYKNVSQIHLIRKDYNSYFIYFFDKEQLKINQRHILLTNQLDSSCYDFTTQNFYCCYSLIENNEIIIIVYKKKVLLKNITSGQFQINLELYKQFVLTQNINIYIHTNVLIFSMKGGKLGFLTNDTLLICLDNKQIYTIINQKLNILRQINYFFPKRIQSENKILYFCIQETDLVCYQICICNGKQAELKKKIFKYILNEGQYDIVELKWNKQEIELWIYDFFIQEVFFYQFEFSTIDKMEHKECKQITLNDFLMRKMKI